MVHKQYLQSIFYRMIEITFIEEFAYLQLQCCYKDIQDLILKLARY